jgi:hypothetical protein
MLNYGHPESHVPRFRVRVDTRRPGGDSRSGCRGFSGLVPQPLFMKSKVCSEEQTCCSYYIASDRPVKLVGTGEGYFTLTAGGMRILRVEKKQNTAGMLRRRC